MGDGAFGSNGSVHWEINNVNPGNGVDESKRHPDDPKGGKPEIGAPGHARKFRVIGRYPNAAKAQAALDDLNARHQAGDTNLVLYVDLREYQDVPGPSSRWEVV